MFDLDTGQILEISYFAHLAGIAAGLGGAAFGYVLVICLLFAGDKGSMHLTLQRVHILVATGLGLLWCSGLTIAFLKFSLPTVPMKLVAKLILASLLLIDAFYVQRTLLPLIRSVPSPLLLHMTWRNVVAIVMCGSVSLTCWLSMLLLATFAPLQQLPPETLILVILLAWSTSALALLAILASANFSICSCGNECRPVRAGG